MPDAPRAGAQRARLVENLARRLPAGQDRALLRCPFHVERKPSLSISVSKGVYYCFGCQAKGRFRSPAQAHRNRPEIEVKRPVRMPKTALRILPVRQITQPAYGYLRRRQLSDAQMARWYYVSYDEYPYGRGRTLVLKNRVIVPIYGPDGRLVYWFGRDITDRQSAKYVNSPEAKVHAFVYNLSEAAPHGAGVIVEGVFDVRGENFAALLGKRMTAEQKQKIVEAFKSVTVFLDQDADKYAWAIAQQLSPFMPVKIAQAFGDPGSMSEKEIAWALNNAKPYTRAAFSDWRLGGTIKEA